MHTFQSQGLVFAYDREGVEIADGEEIEIEIACDDVGLDADNAPEELGARLSRLLGGSVEDEEGIFDLSVSKDGVLVAALCVACEDDTLALGGERAAGISDEAIASALVGALGGDED